MYLLGHVSKVEVNEKMKIIVFQIICFSINYDISDLLFPHLWTLYTAFVLMQAKTGFDSPISNEILPKSGMMLIIHHKYSK